MAERLETATRVLQRVREMDETEADPPLRRVFGDLRRTLRLPVVPSLVGILANWPGFLVPAWGAIGPTMSRQRAEEQCDTVRRYAAYQVADGQRRLEHLLRDDPESARIHAFVDTMHYAIPKLLVTAQLMARLLDPADRGAQGSAEGRVLEAGPIEGMVAPPLLPDPLIEARVQRVLDEVQERNDHLRAASFYRGLAQWPDVLEGVWHEVAPTVGTGEYRYVSRRLQLSAQAAAADLPLRRPRDWELLPRVQDEVQSVLDFYRTAALPDLLQDVTRVKAWLDGEAAAAVSRFSPLD